MSSDLLLRPVSSVSSFAPESSARTGREWIAVVALAEADALVAVCGKSGVDAQGNPAVAGGTRRERRAAADGTRLARRGEGSDRNVGRFRGTFVSVR
jgi:hypothetical protein